MGSKVTAGTGSEGVQADILHTEMDSIENGIVELISQHGMRELVMGAAADKYYSKNKTMHQATRDASSFWPWNILQKSMDLKSRKAIYVCLQAPISCHIKFICNGHLIHTREGSLNEASRNTIAGPSTDLRLSSVRQNDGEIPINPAQYAFSSDKFGGSRTDVLYVEGSTDEGVGFSSIYSPGSSYSTCPSHQVVDIGLITSVRTKDRRIDDTLYTQLEQAMAEVENARLHFKRIASSVKQLQRYKTERDELQRKHDNALNKVQELKSKQGGVSSTHMPDFFSEFSYLEIKEATQNFDPSTKFGDGRYRSIYKGLLRHTQVAIKMLHHHSLQEPFGLQREVDILSKLRHPNLVTLIGSCQEACALIYEYLPNGSLEDQLRCKDKTPPLSWKTRISIAAGLCRVLIFLHSSKPIGIIHGDLTPANILLDANFVSKLSDFGICHLLPHDQSSRNTALGTFAYMDPEFLSTGELTLKSDVYSFGIILLQLLTGRPALRITKDVKYALDFGTLKELLDPLAGDWPFKQAEKLAYLALRCCNPKQKSRPDLVSEVWTVLEPMGTSCGGSSSIRLGSEENCEPPLYLICPISHVSSLA
uniref:RING-type E3 ubiquitin transferase n=1 Tax=Fagus sylvatica TaxID=28930 RepID=A0A2N9FKU1_FAGSY